MRTEDASEIEKPAIVMSPLFRHILLPALSPALFFLVVANPGIVLSCRMRGLLALVIALASILAGLVVTISGAKRKLRGDRSSPWLIVTSLILVIPAIAVILLA